MQFPLSAHDALSDAFFVSEWGAHLSYRTCHETFSGLAHRAGICKRPDTGAQAKPISEVVKDFEQSLEILRPSTRRVYMADAKAALRAACLELWQNPSTDELLALIRESPSEKRISPFLAFLGDGGPKNSLSDQDSAALQNWVIQRLAKQMPEAQRDSEAWFLAVSHSSTSRPSILRAVFWPFSRSFSGRRRA
jgi:hypothetical protein